MKSELKKAYTRAVNGGIDASIKTFEELLVAILAHLTDLDARIEKLEKGH